MTQPAMDEVYDVDTGQWIHIERPVVSDEDDESEIEPEQTVTTESVVTNCADLGKRHKFKDRTTGIMHEQCIVCGASKPAPGTSRGPRSASISAKTVVPLDIVLSGMWSMGASVIGNVVPKPSGPVAARVMQLEAGIAGPKLHKALKKTPIYPYIAIASGQFGWLTDLGMLLLPPILLGAIAQKPELIKPLKAVLVTAIVPVLAEALKHAEQQEQMMKQLEGYDLETIQAANALIDKLFSDAGVESATNSD